MNTTFRLVIICLLLINLYTHAQKFELIAHHLEVKSKHIAYPEVTLTLQVMYTGLGIRTTQNFSSMKIILLEDNDSLQITGIDTTLISNVEVPVLLYLRKFKEKDLAAIQSLITGIDTLVNSMNQDQVQHVHFSFWVPVSGKFTRIPFKRLYNDIFFQKQDEKIADMVSQYFQQQGPIEGKRDKFHLLIGEFKRIKNTGLMNTSLQQLTFRKGQWFGVVYMNKNKNFPPLTDAEVLQNCLLIRPFKEKQLALKLAHAIRNLQQSYLQVRFRVVNLDPRKNPRQYTVKVVLDEDTLQTRFTIQYPQAPMERLFVYRKYAELQEKINKWEVKKLLDKIQEADTIVPADTFKSLAYTVLQRWGEQIISTEQAQQVPQWLTYARNRYRWAFDKDLPTQFKHYAGKLFQLYVQERVKQGASLSEQIQLYDQLIEYQPEPRYRIKSMVLRAQWFQSQQALWKAAHFYQLAYQESQRTEYKKEMYKILNKAFTKLFQNHQWQQIGQRAEEYAPYITHNFTIHFYRAEAARHLQHWAQAQKHYEWLIHNWRHQSFLSWNEAFENLQNIYLQLLEFDKTFQLTQQLYQRNPSRHDLLLKAVINLRAKYVAPFVQVVPLWQQINKATVSEMGTFLSTLKGGQWPHYIKNIAIVDPVWHVVFKLTSSQIPAPATPINRTQNFPTLIQQKQTGLYLFIQKVQGGYLVVQISNKLLPEEQSLIQRIREVPQESAPWYNLLVYVHHQSIPFTSRLLAGILGWQWSHKHDVPLKVYWDYLKKYQYIEYLAIHNAGGQIAYQIRFDPQSYRFPDGDYQRSATTIALFQQKSEKGSDHFIDVCNPIFQGPQFMGVVRLGFKEY